MISFQITRIAKLCLAHREKVKGNRVLLEQHKPRIEVFARAAQGTWIRHAHTGLDTAAELKSLGITLPLAEVYADLFE